MYLGKVTLESEKLALGLVSAGSNGSAHKKVAVISALCFIQFVVSSMRNPVVNRTAKTSSVLLAI